MCRSELFASVRTTSISLRLEMAVVLPAPMGPVKRMTCSAIGTPQSLAEPPEQTLALGRGGLGNNSSRWGLCRTREDAHEAERIDQPLGIAPRNAGVPGELFRAHVGV